MSCRLPECFSKLVGMILALLAGCVPIAGTARAERFVIANGSTLSVYVLDLGTLTKDFSLLDAREWSGVVWPTWDSATRTLIIQGRKAGSAEEVGIFEIKLSNSRGADGIKRIASGRYPALSPDGRRIAAVGQMDHLIVISRDSETAPLKSGPEVGSLRPVVWDGNSSIVYLGTDRRLKRFDIGSETQIDLGFEDLIPVERMTNGTIVCISYDGRRIVLVDLKRHSIAVIKSYHGVSLGPSVILDSSETSMLITRQTWSNLIRLSEERDLFRVRLDGSEEQMASGISMFGGFLLDD